MVTINEKLHKKTLIEPYHWLNKGNFGVNIVAKTKLGFFAYSYHKQTTKILERLITMDWAYPFN